MSNYGSNYGEQKSGSTLRTIFIVALLSFVSGGILSVWAAQRLEIFDGAGKAGAQNSAEPGFESLPPPVGQVNGGLTAKQTTISETPAVTGITAGTNGIMAVISARRAIENGAALGSIEGDLQSRFGTSRPDDVAAVIRLAKSPVTLDLLRAELSAQGDGWLAQDDMSAWARFQKELSTLFVLRKEGTASPVPARRLERARQFTEIGNIEAAIAEVKNLPGAKQAGGWLNRADSYVSVRKALDSIEKAVLTRAVAVAAAKPEANQIVSLTETPDVKSEATTAASADDRTPE